MMDRTGYAELLAKRPVLFHRVWDADDAKLESILSNGLERDGTLYDGFWQSRPGHVYIGDRPTVLGIQLNGEGVDVGRPWDLLRIDTTLLDRRRINPDEDHFLTHNFIDHEAARMGERLCRRFRVPFPPSKWVWEWANYLGIGPVPNLGEWADAVSLGEDPDEARHSAALGTLAFRGVVPPEAIRLASSTREVDPRLVLR